MSGPGTDLNKFALRISHTRAPNIGSLQASLAITEPLNAGQF